MRKLVTIRKIGKKYPIKEKDRIELCAVDGWTVITKKDEFQEGDYCVFFEIDSFLPLEDKYSFLEKYKRTNQGKEGYRIKTMKMAGVISQGLALPINLFPEIKNHFIDDQNKMTSEYLLNPDISEMLGVIKYDTSFLNTKNNTNNVSLSPFPSFIPQTDQERIQNLINYFDIHKDTKFEETLKLDGSSMTCYKVTKKLNIFQKILKFFNIIKDTHYGVCSRNFEISLTKDSNEGELNFWAASKKYNLQEKIPPGYAVQGELVGPKIQSNHEKVQDLEFYCFDVYDIEHERYLDPAERRDFCRFHNIPHVPVVNESVEIFKELKNLDDLLKRVEGPSMNPQTNSEGRVYKSYTGVSFKVISNKYLLKNEK